MFELRILQRLKVGTTNNLLVKAVNSKWLTTCLVWGLGVRSEVEEITILNSGTRVGRKGKMVPTRQLHVCNKTGEGEVRSKVHFLVNN